MVIPRVAKMSGNDDYCRAVVSRGIPLQGPALSECSPPVPPQAPGLHALSPEPLADRQWSDGGGVQDGVRAASEALGDGVERRRGPADRRPSGHPFERRLGGGAPVVLKIAEATRESDSARFREEEAQKSRVILGLGSTAPLPVVPSRYSFRSGQAGRPRPRRYRR